MKILGIVPARGGSKGVPGKNIRILGEKPLIVRTLDAAMNSGCLSRVIVTTDSDEIRQVVLNAGYEVPFRRPIDLAQDDTPLIKPVTHALGFAEKTDGPYDAVCLLQPTSPFRTGVHIREAAGIFEKSGADSVVSVVKVPHRFVPTSLMKEEKGMLVHYIAKDVSYTRHSDEKLWGRNGPAVLFTKAEYIRRNSFYGLVIQGYQMDFISSIDIDEEEDWSLAERIVRIEQ